MSADLEGGRGPVRGVGLGLRAQHYAEILQGRPAVPWFEVLTDNYLGDGGLPLYHLEQVRRDYPITCHGVGLSLGSADPLNHDYVNRLRGLVERIEPAWVSDHLSWSASGGHYSHDLLPLPYTEEAIGHLARRIRQVQEALGRRLVVENVSSYVEFADSEMPEWAFLTAVAEEADCEILLDINNIYVNACNHGYDPLSYLRGVPLARVREMHLAGYEDCGTHLLDTHGEPVHGPVWALYEAAVQRLPEVPTLIEWDTRIPPFERLLEEAAKAQRVRERVGICDVA